MNQKTLDDLNIIFSRYIVLFGGEYGRCKSLSLTAITFFESLMTDRKNILSNMPMKFPILKDVEVHPLVQTSQFDLAAMSEIKGSIIIWDEIFNDVKARSPMSETNKYVTQMGVGFRKDDIRLRGSLQFFDTLEMMIGQMLELIIIPSFINRYSDDTKKDHVARMEEKDFWVRWKCLDKKIGNEFAIEINLYPFLGWYNTNFKPYKLILTHKEYMAKIQRDKKRYFESYLETCESEIELNIENWKTGLDEIGTAT